ncbi:MAG: ThuA domain-containing protein [Muricauda sp.]|nr:ThuA domain-containing protein [Allomuricauda sp.]MBA4745675.1 ThuA domain-containing protein [Allomuricauda sp.]
MRNALVLLLFASISFNCLGQNVKNLNILLITGVGITGPDHMYSNWSHRHYNDVLVDYLSDFAQVRITKDLSELNERNLEHYDVIINNSLFHEPTEEQFNAFYKFIESGKSYFAIHAGLVSFLNSDKYLKMMGGKFINHDDIKTFTVNTSDYWYGWESEDNGYKHPIVRELGDFKTLDELYLVQFNTDSLEVIARAEYHPIMWTRNWGKGRVMCLTLGHGKYSQKNEGFKSLFTNGVKWLTGQLD